jgi:hypothetical protein
MNAIVEEKINIYDKEVEQVDSFTYIGSCAIKDDGTDEFVRGMTRKTNCASI